MPTTLLSPLRIDPTRTATLQRRVRVLVGNEYRRAATRPHYLRGISPNVSLSFLQEYGRVLARAYRTGYTRSLYDVHRPSLSVLGVNAVSDIADVTDSQRQAISALLSTATQFGVNPKKIATQLAKQTGLSKERALLIAQTELIGVYAEGQLDALEAAGVSEVTAQVEWLTAGDSRVCPRCAAMEGVKLKIADARGKIPLHPRCRCAWVPAEGISLRDEPAAVSVSPPDVPRTSSRQNDIGHKYGPKQKVTGEPATKPTDSDTSTPSLTSAPPPDARPPRPVNTWSNDQQITDHASKMVQSHENDPYVKDVEDTRQGWERRRKQLEAQLAKEYDKTKWKALEVEYLKAKANEVKAQEVLAHEARRTMILSFGPSDPRQKGLIVATTSKAGQEQTDAFTKASGFLQEIGTQDGLGVQNVKVQNTKGRASYDKGKIMLTKTDDPAIAAHEFGHHLEEQPWVKERVREFQAKRYKPEEQVKMVDVDPNAGYEPNEIGNPDKMLAVWKGDANKAAYTGKTYRDGGSEIVSMGVELMYRDPVHFAKSDPEYFNLIMGILQKGPVNP